MCVGVKLFLSVAGFCKFTSTLLSVTGLSLDPFRSTWINNFEFIEMEPSQTYLGPVLYSYTASFLFMEKEKFINQFSPWEFLHETETELNLITKNDNFNQENFTLFQGNFNHSALGALYISA